MINKHPPANRRCQIYMGGPELNRCENTGTHWEKWGGCGCTPPDIDPEVCEGDYYSWECDGVHAIPEAVAC